jgi:hypothetical protein
MAAPRLRFGFVLDDFDFSVDLSLAPLMDWYEDFCGRPKLGEAPALYVYVWCPCCGADIQSLTSVCEEGEHLRACRSCHSRFEAD